MTSLGVRETEFERPLDTGISSSATQALEPDLVVHKLSTIIIANIQYNGILSAFME